VSFFVEFYWEKLLNVAEDSLKTGPLERSRSLLTLSPGVEFKSASGSGLKLGADINLNSGDKPAYINAPDWGVWLVFSQQVEIVPRDSDHDGVKDKDDACPDEPEDADGFEDSDGCPDLDNDGDGIPDAQDACPDLAEDVDGYEDSDGCPDLDNDLDGIPDDVDNCPNSPETFNGYQDEDGCPDERPIEEKFVLRGVNFESGSAALTPDSYAVLDNVVRSLQAYPEVRVEIRGHTDSQGPASFNVELSQRRAESVKQYLINSGIDPTRLVSKGVGEEEPVASNANPEGRAQNRRIEFRRLN
jgi:OOP family OmpA-OmpF porin